MTSRNVRNRKKKNFETVVSADLKVVSTFFFLMVFNKLSKIVVSIFSPKNIVHKIVWKKKSSECFSKMLSKKTTGCPPIPDSRQTHREERQEPAAWPLIRPEVCREERPLPEEDKPDLHGSGRHVPGRHPALVPGHLLLPGRTRVAERADMARNSFRATSLCKGQPNILYYYQFICRKYENLKIRHCLIDQAIAILKSGSCLIYQLYACLKSGTVWLIRQSPDLNQAAA